jgi:hypothetical protein
MADDRTSTCWGSVYRISCSWVEVLISYVLLFGVTHLSVRLSSQIAVVTGSNTCSSTPPSPHSCLIPLSSCATATMLLTVQTCEQRGVITALCCNRGAVRGGVCRRRDGASARRCCDCWRRTNIDLSSAPSSELSFSWHIALSSVLYRSALLSNVCKFGHIIRPT